jgi:tRNA pseudouridine55 synthase
MCESFEADLNGIIVVDKPTGMTSFTAANTVRKAAMAKKAGHTGTLDPMATGVLPILIGKATKASDIIPNSDKEYEAGFEFGRQSDTLDVWGKITGEDTVHVSTETLSGIIPRFIGEIYQIPPMYSAVSINGRRLYELAREGIEIERDRRKINIYELKVLSYDERGRSGKLLISCSKGTYIRTLIDDMAKACGCTGGIMTALRRTKACGFTIEEAVGLQNVCESPKKFIIETDALFSGYRKIIVSPAQAIRFQNGGFLDIERLSIEGTKPENDERFRVYGDEFLGIAKVDKDKGILSIIKLLRQNGNNQKNQ